MSSQKRKTAENIIEQIKQEMREMKYNNQGFLEEIRGLTDDDTCRAIAAIQIAKIQAKTAAIEAEVEIERLIQEV